MISAPPQAAVRPVQVQLGGQADANGQWTNGPGQQLHNANWAVFKVVATCGVYASSSGIRWEISTGGNRPLDFGWGADISTGAMMVGPGEMVNVSCSGAAPGAVIRGQFVGVMASYVGNIINQYIPAPNPLSGVTTYQMEQSLTAIQQALERMSPPPPGPAPPFVIGGYTS